MNEPKTDQKITEESVRRGRDIENRDLYTVSPRGSEFARKKAEQYFQTMKDENASYKQRAEVAGMDEETYRLGDAFADMSNYLIMEAYGQMMDLKELDAREAFYDQINSGLGNLVGIDGLTQDHIDTLRGLWAKAAGQALPDKAFTLTDAQKAELDKRRRELEERKKKKEGTGSSST